MRTDRKMTFREILAHLELMPHGKTQSFNATAGRSSERDPRPQGETKPPHILWRLEYEAQTDDLGRQRVHKEALDELLEFMNGNREKPPAEDPKQRRKEIVEKGEGWTAREVANVYRTTVAEIMEIRKAANRDPSTGREAIADEDVLEQARRLHEQGLTVTQIAKYQKCDTSTASRRIRRVA